MAAFTTYKQDVDVAIFGLPDRRLYKNLTKGLTTKYQYLVAQGLTTAPAEGRDLAFSPDGNSVAVFARTQRTRSLLLLDVRKGGIAKQYDIELPVDQAAQPAFSPDGRTVAFHAVSNGQYDIFLLDLETGQVTNLTDDEPYDASPAYSPDGMSLVYTSNRGEGGKLIRLELADPTKREQLTFGPGQDEGAAFSADGERLYFTPELSMEVQLGLGANSPYFFGRELWRETRIAVFEQATDTRPDELKAQGVRPRVWFGERWITSIFDLFEENVRYFPPLLPICESEDPVEVLHAGGVPELAELRLHNGTVTVTSGTYAGVLFDAQCLMFLKAFYPEDRAIDWLIGRGVRVIDAVLRGVRAVGGAIRSGAQRMVQWWRARRRFRNTSARCAIAIT